MDINWMASVWILSWPPSLIISTCFTLLVPLHGAGNNILKSVILAILGKHFWRNQNAGLSYKSGKPIMIHTVSFFPASSVVEELLLVVTWGGGGGWCWWSVLTDRIYSIGNYVRVFLNYFFSPPLLWSFGVSKFLCSFLASLILVVSFCLNGVLSCFPDTLLNVLDTFCGQFCYLDLDLGFSNPQFLCSPFLFILFHQSWYQLFHLPDMFFPLLQL